MEMKSHFSLLLFFVLLSFGQVSFQVYVEDVIPVDPSSSSSLISSQPPFPDYCSYDWHAVLTVNGTMNNAPFGPEPAEEWSSFSRSLFRYLLPEHDTWDPNLEIGLGATTYTENGGAIWFVYTSYCCQALGTWPTHGNCEAWFSCNILALSYRNDACILSTIQPWVYGGTAVVNGTKCNYWTQAKAGTPGQFQNFYASIEDDTPVLYHWKSDLIIGVEEFEEWLFFTQFDKESQPLPASTFDIGELHPACLPLPTTQCITYGSEAF